MVSATSYPIDFTLSVKGQEQVSAAQTLFDKLSKVLSDAIPLFTQLGEASARSGQAIAQSQGALSGVVGKTTTEITKESTAMTQLDASSSKVKTSMDQTGTAFTKVNAELAKSGQELTKVKTSVDQTAQSETKLQTSTKALSDTFTQTKTAVTGVAQEMDKGKQSSTSLAAAIDSAKQKTDQVKGSFDEAGNAITRTGAAAEQTSTRFSLFKENAGTLLTGISQLVSTGFELEHTFMAWEKAQTGLDKATLKVGKSTEAVEKTHKKYLATLKDTSKSQEDINDAFRDYQQALDANSIATETLQQKQDSLDTSYKSFAFQTVPGMVTGLAGTVNTFQSLAKIFKGQKVDTDALTGSTDEFTDAMNWASQGAGDASGTLAEFGGAAGAAAEASKDLGTNANDLATVISGARDTVSFGSSGFNLYKGAIKGTTEEFKHMKDPLNQFSRNMEGASGATTGAAAGGSRLLGVLGPIGVAIAAVVTTVALVNTNMFGFRNVLNNVGEAMGNMFPPIRGALDLLKGFTGQIGLSGEAMEEWGPAVQRGMDALTKGIESVKPVLTQLAGGVEETLNQLGYAFDYAAKNFNTIVDEWNSTVDAFNSTIHFFTVEIPDAIKGVGESFLNMFAALSEDPAGVLEEFGKSIIDGIGQLAEDMAPSLEEMGTAIVDGFGQLGEAALDGFGKAFADLSNWAKTNITDPFNTALGQLATDAQISAGKAWNNLIEPFAQINQWLEQDIITPIRTALTGIAIDAQVSGDTAWTNLTDAWKEASKWFTDNVITPLDSVWETFKTGAGAAGAEGYQALTEKWAGIATWWDGIMKQLGGGWESLFNANKTEVDPTASLQNKAAAEQAKQNYLNSQLNLDTTNQNIPTNTTPLKQYDLKDLTTKGNPWSTDGIAAYNTEMGKYIQVTGEANGWGTQFFGTLTNLAKGHKDDAKATEEGTTAQAKQLTVAQQHQRQIEAQKEAQQELTDANMAYATSFAPMLEGIAVTDKQASFLAATVKASVDAFNKQEAAVRAAAVALGTNLATAAKASIGDLKELIAITDSAERGMTAFKAAFEGLEKGDNGLTKGVKGENKEAERENRFLSDLPKIVAEANAGMESPVKEIEKKLDKLKDANKYTPAEWRSKFGELETILHNPKLSGDDLAYQLMFNFGQIEDSAKNVFDGVKYISQSVAESFSKMGPEIAEAMSKGEDPSAIIGKWGVKISAATGQSLEDVKAQMTGIKNAVELAGGDVATFSGLLVKYLTDIGTPKPIIDEMVRSLNGINTTVAAGDPTGGPAGKGIEAIGGYAADATKKVEALGKAMIGVGASAGAIGSVGSLNGLVTSGGDGSSKTPGNSNPVTITSASQLGSKGKSSSTGGFIKTSGSSGSGGMGNPFATKSDGPGGGQTGEEPIVIPVIIDTTAVAPAMESLRTGINTTITNIITDAQGLGPGIAAGFKAAAEQSAPIMASIRDGFNGMVSTLISDAQGIGPGVAAAFSAARSNSSASITGIGTDFLTNVVGKITSGMAGLGTNVVAQFEAMRSGIISKFNAIGAAAQNTFNQILGYVQAVTAEIKSVPTDINVTYHVAVVGDKPPTQAAAGFQGIVTGSHVMTVGEAGPELVSVIPLKSTKMGPGNRSFAAEGFQGIVGADAASHTNPSIITGAGGGGSNGLMDVRIVSIGPNSPVNAMLPVVLVGSTIGGIGGAGTTGGGGTSTTGGTGGGIGNNSGTSTQTNNQSNTGTNSGGTGGSGTGTTPYTKPSYVVESGTGAKWQGANQDPKTWTATEMTDPDKRGLFKVVDSSGKNIATEFKTKGEADAYIAGKQGTPNPGTGGTGTTPPTGGGMGGNPPPSTMPREYYAGGDYDPADLQTSGSGSRWQGANQDPKTWKVSKMDNGSGWKVVDDKGKNIATGFGAEDQAGGYIDDAVHGHGYNDTSSPDFIDDYGRPTSGGDSTPSGGSGAGGQVPSTGGTTGGTGGTGTGVQASNLQALKFGDSDTYASASTPTGATFGQVSSGRWVANKTGAGLSPEDWFIKKQSNGKFKIMDGSGKDVAVDFNTLSEAQNFINFYITDMEKKNPGKEFGDTTIPLYKDKTTGKVYAQDASGKLYEKSGDYSDYTVDPNTTALPVTGGVTSGTGGTPGGTYTPPSDIQTSGTGAKWQGANQDPKTWMSTEMTDADKKGLWKVVDDKGKNVAANFKSKADADAWIAFKQGVNVPNNPPVPGTGGTTGGTGGTGTGTTTPGQTQSQTGGGYYYMSQNGKVLTNMPKEMQAQFGLPVVEPTGAAPTPGTGTGTQTNNQNTTGENNFNYQNSGNAQNNFPGLGVTTGAGVGNPSTQQPDAYVEFSSGGKSYFWSRQGGIVTSNAPASALASQGLSMPNAYGGVIPNPIPGGGSGMGGLPGSGIGGTGSGGSNNMVVDGPNAKVVLNGMVVDGKTGTVTMGNGTVVGPNGVVMGSGTPGGTGGTGAGSPLWGTGGWPLGGLGGVGPDRSPIGAPTVVGTIGMPSGVVPGGVGTGTSVQYTDERGNNYNYQQDINQTSNVSGGGVQTNSGQNLYYQNQNGKINTNMKGGFPSWLGGLFGGFGGLPGGSGTSGEWNGKGVRPEPTFEQLRTGMDNTVPAYDVGPVSEAPDFATQLFRTGGPGGSGGGGGIPGLGKFPFWEIIETLMKRITDGLKGLNMSINLDGQSIFNSYSVDLMKKYNAQF